MRVEITYASGSRHWQRTLRDMLIGLDAVRLPYEVDLVEFTGCGAPNRAAQPVRLPMVRIDADGIERPLARAQR